MSDKAMKFRAWNKKDKKWFRGDEVILEFISAKFAEPAEITLTTFNKIFQNNEYVEWLQFTGLTDNGGREIYDGDILSVEGLFETHYAQVTWGASQQLSSWDGAETWLLHFADNGVSKRVEAPLYPYCQERCGYNVLIIGNVYEHPELLQTEKQ